MEENFTELNSKRNFELSDEAQGFLKETAKWAYFLSILGFVLVGLLVVLALFIGTLFSTLGSMSGTMNPIMGMGNGFISGIYLVMALLYFFPIYYLFLFSSKVKKAFKTDDKLLLNDSFQYLKSHYKFMGIAAVIFVAFYALVLFITLIVGVFSVF
jgi:uncharacterized oligopeptide transporter (OPT) family protein